MSALSIQVPFPVFQDRDGQPLDNGYVWIGEANLDPQGNPINIYWDAELTISAPQPIRTLNGYPSRSGTPARLYVNSDYSIRVQNSKGSLVYSAPQATERYSEVVFGANAEDVLYDPPFTNAVQTNVEAKLAQTVSAKDFGAVGDGVADDTVAVQAALDSDQPLDWGGLTYRITSTVSRTATKDVFWQGRNATIIYDGAHTQRAVFLQGGGLEIVLNDITVDGGKLVNRCLEIDNNTDGYSNLTCNNVFVTRAKRLNTFVGGDGMLVRGSYYAVAINGGGASDCELPAGQGTVGSIGIGGISVIFYSTTRYVKAMYVNGARIEKIYSSDLTYDSDQDGIKYFSPTDGTTKIESLFSCLNSEFVNCYGRAIKTQCRDTVVEASSFIRTEGLISGEGNNEIDAQTGNGNFRDLTFSYSNGQQPGSCVNVSGGATNGKPGLVVDGCSVYLDGVTLKNFASCFPRDSFFSRHSITNCKIFGTVQVFFNYLCNGDKNYAEVSNNYVQEIADGVTSQKALVYVKSSGAITPFSANTVAYGNVYGGSGVAALVRDSISGNSMPSVLSAWNNFGFQTNDISVTAGVNGLKTNAIARMEKIGAASGNGYFQVQNITVAPGATGTLAISNVNRYPLVFITAQLEFQPSYAFFANNSTTNTVLNKSATFEFGNTTNPGLGVFRVWSSAANQLSIQNTNVANRQFAVFVMAI